MERDDIRPALRTAEASFERAPETVETGLDVDDPELVQLRRTCRLLAAGSLVREAGYYTVGIESSFVAIERTIQFRLVHDGAMEPSEVISSHHRLYQRGAEIGLYDDAFGDALAELWRRNRTRTYYRHGVATREQASAVHDLATALHGHLVDASRVRHECLCEE